MKKKITFLVINLLISIFVLELILQLTYKFTAGDYLINRANIPLYQSDDYSCWNVKRNLNISHKTNEFNYNIYTNNLSHRVKDQSNKKFKLKNGKTVLFMGPSFGFGWGVKYEKSYAYLIGELYRKNDYKNIINTSVPGHLPTQQLCWYLKEGHKFNPDVIVVTLTSKPHLYISENINLENPDFCIELCTNYIVNDGILSRNTNNLFSNPKWYLKNSALVFYNWYFFSKIRSYFISDSEITESAIGLEFHDLSNYSENNYEAMYENYINLVKSKNIKTKVIFLFIPDSYNIHLSDRARWSHQNIDFEGSLNGYRKNIKLLNEKYNFIDTFPHLTKRSKTKRLYHYVDTHFNELGNQFTFDIFEKYCIRKDCF